MYTGPNGREYVRKIGTRQEVFDEVCFCTSGKLEKKDFILKNNKIVSKRRSQMGKKRFLEKGNPFKNEPVVEPKRDTPDVEQRPRRETAAERRARKKKRTF